MRKNERELINLFVEKIESALTKSLREIGGYLGELQRIAGDGTRDRADSGRAASVPQEPGGLSNSQTTGPVESPPRGNRQAPPGKHPLDTDYWTWSGYRGEYTCPHGVGHGNHIHGCCHEHCCTRADFPLRGEQA